MGILLDYCDRGQEGFTAQCTKMILAKHAKQDDLKAKRQEETTEHEKKGT
jgi:hypothetical protein